MMWRKAAMDKKIEVISQAPLVPVVSLGRSLWKQAVARSPHIGGGGYFASSDQ